MSERRNPGDLVRRKPGSCFIGASEPALVRLTDASDGDLHDIDACMMDCGDPDCREWANAQVVGGPYAGGWVFHLAECQMEKP
jgi:hypothetical protein